MCCTVCCGGPQKQSPSVQPEHQFTVELFHCCWPCGVRGTLIYCMSARVYKRVVCWNFPNLWCVTSTLVHVYNHFGSANISPSLSLCPTTASWLSKSGNSGKNNNTFISSCHCTSVATKIQQNHWNQLESRPGCHLPDMWQPPLASATDRLVSIMVIKLSILG